MDNRGIKYPRETRELQTSYGGKSVDSNTVLRQKLKKELYVKLAQNSYY